MARYPMYENAYYVFFNKDRIGPWRGGEAMRGKTVLSQPGYYAQLNFPVPVNIKYVANGTQALGMILLGRGDFYVDDMSFIKSSIRDNTIAYDESEFDIKQAGVRSYHPLFNTSPRGKAVMKLYEDGMMKLHRSGKLRPIFTKWGHPYPDFDNH
jgi:ABC-type amino acid transport substrate-binding protein